MGYKILDVKADIHEEVEKYCREMNSLYPTLGFCQEMQDDILDIESDTSTLGKPQGSDLALNKPTYPNLLGLDGAKEMANKLYYKAIKCLDVFDEKAKMLREIANYIINRSK